jgi:hypothetical protein
VDKVCTKCGQREDKVGTKRGKVWTKCEQSVNKVVAKSEDKV